MCSSCRRQASRAIALSSIALCTCHQQSQLAVPSCKQSRSAPADFIDDSLRSPPSPPPSRPLLSSCPAATRPTSRCPRSTPRTRMRRASSSKLSLNTPNHNHIARQDARCSVPYILRMADGVNDWWDACSRRRVLIVHRSFVQKAEEKVEKVTGKH